MAAFELNIGVADFFSNDRRVSPRKVKHIIGHINANNFAFRSDDLRRNKANFSAA